MIILHGLRWYWDWAGSNIGAMPGCGLVAVLSGVLFRRPVARWWHKHFGVQADLTEIRKIAEDGRKIAADLHKHVTGRTHPLAPDDKAKGVK